MNRMILTLGMNLYEEEAETNTAQSPKNFEAAAPQIDSSSSKSKAIRALVVDDLDLHCKLTLRYLNRVGVKADTAMNGSEALRKFQTCAYNLVFLDLNMPHMDGFTTTRKIRELQLAERPFLVACSASIAINARERCLSEGFDAYLPKPIHPEDLLDIMDQFRSSRLTLRKSA